MKRRKIGICHHTSIARGTYRDDHGTPHEIIKMVLACFGSDTSSPPSFALDLASSEKANKIVDAGRFYSLKDPCPADPPVRRGQLVWCNAPGPGKKVKAFWEIWLRCLERGAEGAFLIYNMDTWRQLRESDRELGVLVLRKRVHYIGAKHGANFPSAIVFSFFDRPTEAEGWGHWVRW